MIDFYLKASSRQELFDVLVAAKIARQATDFRLEDVEGEFVTEYVYQLSDGSEFTSKMELSLNDLDSENEAVLLRTQEVPKQHLVEFPIDDYFVADPYKYALDVIGVIHKPTGEMIVDSETGTEFPAMAPIEGFHANLRVLANEFDSSNISQLVISAPNNPVRGWA